MGVGRIGRAGQAGVTLVELLVVLAILALASTAVLLNAPPARSPAEEEADRLAARLKIAQDDSLITGRSLRIVFDDTGYDFEVFQEGKWAPVADNDFLARRDFTNGVTAEVVIDEDAMANAAALGENARPDIADETLRLSLDPLGAAPRLRIRLSGPRGAWVVNSGEGENVEVARDG